MTMGAATIPDVLVGTDWVAQHLNDTSIRIVEVDVDTAAYDQGHVPSAIAWNWTTELCDTLVRDIIPPAKFEALMAKSGVGNDTTVILYGSAGVTPDRPVIAYCRIGERSSHTWFVLKHLLGYPDVKNYDGSWTEWGNLVGAPVEKP